MQRENQSKLNRLIQELCPEGVEYRKLGEVVEVCRGNRLIRSELSPEGKIPVFQNSLIPLGYNDESNCSANSTFMISAGAAGDIGYSTVDFWAADDCFIFKEYKHGTLSSRYLYHELLRQQTFIYSKVRRSSIPRLSRKDVEKLPIPVPPLPVQSEIVRILDAFTALTAELTEKLTAELTARRKQYEYYRDRLLNFDDLTGGAVWRNLGDIASVTRGGNFQKKDFVESGVPCIHYGQIYTKYGVGATKTFSYIPQEVATTQKFAEANDVVMAVTSENLEDVCKCLVWEGSEKVAISGHTAIIKSNVVGKYLAYYFQTESFFQQKKRLAHGTKVIEVTPDSLLKVKIPLPPLSEQRRIVSILDRFDALCNDLTQGLPAEIAARRKQYEFYRDRLLDFQRKV